MEMSGQFHPLPLYPRYPPDRELGVLYSQPGSCGKEKNNLFPLSGIEH
jgi:hypothetical protein